MSRSPQGDVQSRIYTFLVACHQQGINPTIREIGSVMQITSVGHIHHHLKELTKKGLIVRTFGRSRSIRLTRPSGIPISGAIAAGVPLDIFPSPSEFLLVDQNLQVADAFALLVRGRSMIEDHICDGDYVVVRPQSMCQDGEIIVATHLQGGVSGSATLKRFFKEREYVRLQPANNEMEPILIPRDEWDREWKIQGKVLAILRAFSNNKVV